MKDTIRIADRILYEDQDLVVVHKIPGIDSQSSSSFRPDMVSLLKNYYSEKEHKPYIGVVHRLDQPVEGILVYARNPGSAAKLSKLIESRQVTKIYYALVFGTPSHEERTLCDLLETDRRTHRARVVSMPGKETKKAELSFRNVSDTALSDAGMEEKRRALGEEICSVVRIRLGTGRFHQIRVQMMHAGFPLVGDRRYAAESDISPELIKRGEEICPNVALCATELSFVHPATGRKMDFSLRKAPSGFD